MLTLEHGGGARQGTRANGSYLTASIFLLYFLALGVLGFISAFATPALGWWATPADLPKLGLNDPVSFMTGALDIARHGWVTPANYWLLHLWPPGFMTLEAVVLRVFGERSTFLIPLLTLSALACASWMILLRRLLLPACSNLVATIAPAVPFLFPVTPFFLLSPVGLVLGETFSISFFLMGFVLVLLALRERSRRKAATAGIALALSAYFRSQFELLVTSLTIAAVVLALCAVATRFLRGRAWPEWAPVGLMVITIMAAQLAMAPWRYHNFRDMGTPVWVQTSQLIARNSLASEQELLAAGGAFVIAGAGNLACKMEPSYCGKPDLELFYKAFLRHPGTWLLEKARVLPAYWSAPPVTRSLSNVSVPPTTLQTLVNLVLLACLFAGWWRLWRIRSEPEFATHAWFQLSFYAALLAVYTLAHFEARYFYLPKIFGVVALIALLVPGRVRRFTGLRQ